MKKYFFYLCILTFFISFCFVIYSFHYGYTQSIVMLKKKCKSVKLDLKKVKGQRDRYLSDIRLYFKKQKKKRYLERDLFRYIHKQEMELQDFHLISIKRHESEDLSFCQRVCIDLSFYSTWGESQKFLKNLRQKELHIFFKKISFMSDQVEVDYVKGQVSLVLFLLNK